VVEKPLKKVCPAWNFSTAPAKCAAYWNLKT
jgi:hypothetical protein